MQRFPDLILGLGTVMDPKTADKGIQNRADFLVKVRLYPRVVKFTGDENVNWIPGCSAPTGYSLHRMMARL
jgi:2-dehydro-3-deoxyphosphogluconate aldolase/(4S)-4-hydroxy-2-oxoglutarate aldolase